MQRVRKAADVARERPTELITALVAAFLVLLVEFGVALTENQILAIIGFVGLLPAAVTWVVEQLRS